MEILRLQHTTFEHFSHFYFFHKLAYKSSGVVRSHTLFVLSILDSHHKLTLHRILRNNDTQPFWTVSDVPVLAEMTEKDWYQTLHHIHILRYLLGS